MGRGKECASKQELSKDDIKKRGVWLLLIVLFLANIGDDNKREMHGGKMSIGHGAHSHDCVCSHWECARELTLCCVAEITEVWIPIQICHTF